MGRQSSAKKAKIKAANKHSTHLENLAKARKAAIKRMNEALTTKFDILESKFQSLQSENIVFYYGVGEIAREIKREPGKYVGNDGTPAMELLEEALVTQARVLRKCASFAEAYTRKEMEKLTELRNTETGFTLHWAHVSYLLTLLSPAEREKFAHEAVARMWDPGMLHERIKKALGRSGGHGRKHGLPPTVEKQVRQIRDLSRTWLEKQQQVWNGPKVNVFNNVINAGKRQITPEILDYLIELRESMLDMSDATRQNERHVESAIVHVRQVLEERAAETVSTRPKGAQPQRELEIAAAG